MSYAVCRMQKVKSAGLKGMQFHNQRERKSRTNDDIDHERTRENYDLKNDKNIDEEKYDRSFETNLGEIRYPSFYEMMLDKDNLIDYLPNSYGLYLKSEAGIIADQVQLIIKL